MKFFKMENEIVDNSVLTKMDSSNRYTELKILWH